MKTKNELNKISNVVIQKKSKGSLKEKKYSRIKKLIEQKSWKELENMN